MRPAGSGARTFAIAASAVLLLAFCLRLYGLRAGLPSVNDSDELVFQLGALKMLRHKLNPGWFGHPGLMTMYALAITDVAVFLVGLANGRFADIKGFADAIYADPTILILPGRLVMVAASLGCVWLVLQFGRCQWGRKAGLAGAALVAVSPVFVVWSQVIRSDIFACFFMLLALLTAQRMVQRGIRRRDMVLAALWTAAAVASKWPFAVITLSVAGAIALDLRRANAGWGRIVQSLAAYAGLSLVWLVLISPYLLLDFSDVLRNVAGEAQQRHIGATGGSPLWNAWWYISGPILRGLGWPAAALALCGLIRLRHEPEAAVLIVPPLAGFAVLLVSQNIVWERWALLLIVLLAIPLGAVMDQLAGKVPAPRWRRPALVLLCTVVFALPIWQSVWQGYARSNDTRQRASAWARAHFEPGSRVLIENFAFDLLPQPWTFYFPLGDVGCVNANDWLHGKVDYARVQGGRGMRSNVDYGTLSGYREASCTADYAIITQYDRYRAESLAYPEEVARYERLFARGRIVAEFLPVRDESSGPVVRIVKFKPTRH